MYIKKNLGMNLSADRLFQTLYWRLCWNCNTTIINFARNNNFDSLSLFPERLSIVQWLCSLHYFEWNTFQIIQKLVTQPMLSRLEVYRDRNQINETIKEAVVSWLRFAYTQSVILNYKSLLIILIQIMFSKWWYYCLNSEKN